MRSINRRDIFPAFGAAALAGIAAAGLAKPETLTAAPAAKPEGHSLIIAARHEYFKNIHLADVMSAGNPPQSYPSHPDYEIWDRKHFSLLEKAWDAAAFMAAAPSKTWADVKAKAQVANKEFTDYCAFHVMENQSNETRLALSIIQDIARLSEQEA